MKQVLLAIAFLILALVLQTTMAQMVVRGTAALDFVLDHEPQELLVAKLARVRLRHADLEALKHPTEVEGLELLQVAKLVR